MGKIKSAIITAILVAAIVVLAFFATVSFPVAGSGKVNKYNSFITSINLGGDLTGEAVAVLYPKGVISEADYNFGIPEVPEKTDDNSKEVEEAQKKHDEYIEKYEKIGNLYVEQEVLVDDKDGKELIKSVKHDAEILSKRLGEKGYSSYSVSVRDDLTLVVSVPTNYSYSDYRDTEHTKSENSRTDKQTIVSNAIKNMAFGGELSLRNSEVGEGHDKILTKINDDVNSYFKGFKKLSRGGGHYVRVDLTKVGVEKFEDISKRVSAASNEKAVGFYVGDSQLLSLGLEEEISQESFLITVPDEQTAINYATVLNSCIDGEAITLDYGTANDIDIIYTSPALGNNAAIFLFCSLLAIIVAAIVYSAVRYRMLGFVNAIVIIMYSLTIVVALMLIGIQLTVTGAIFAMAGLALLCGSNFVLFEKVRQETQKGKTMQSAVKSAYKSLLKGILELHIVLVAVSLILALVGVGELAACGLIFFIASIASYLLYWFTRFMWFVVSSTVRDKFAFCGFKREELEDD
ncbi:MAG: hypothetical protein K2N23_00975 [Clostridia bacterium]|nr:hypothetical protein [Clostridia bacterium]